LDSQNKQLRLNLLDIAYRDFGRASDTPVIFLHGFPDDVSTWEAVTQRLSGEPLRLLIPWLRGFGGTVPRDEAKSGQIAALAQDVLDFADALGIDRFFLVGQDWGARAAQGTAVLAPDRVRGLLTFATGYGQGDVSAEIKLDQERAFWYQWLFQTPHGRSLFADDTVNFCRYLWRVWSPLWRFSPEEYSSVARSFDNPQFLETVLHYYAHRWKSAPGNSLYSQQQALLDKTPQIIVPSIFACGLADACNLAEYSRGNERFFAGPYTRIEIPEVGHFVQRERPELVAELVRKLLSDT
jgi:pimeloyl-ACP methyl ester carboxylesterase